ncbi:MAG TPA: acylphosphatase [Candidatus Binataceae bacterium]|nr:acylphosphatase [Candidatus Binataceae bacterium]
MPQSQHSRLHLIISGRVQGVFFRASAADRANQLGLTGYARNLPDGTVEIVAEGCADALKLLAEWAKQGPSHAHVEHVDEKWLPFRGQFQSFRVA